MSDICYEDVSFVLSECQHRYGPQVHVLNSPYLLTLLAQLGSPETQQPQVSALVRFIYRDLVTHILNREFPRRRACVPTRMQQMTPAGVYEGDVIEPKVRAVSVNIARAGTVPSETTYELLNMVLEPKLVRQDHIVMSRVVDAAGHVVGSTIGVAKIGGRVDDAYVIFPDPMGATGGSLSTAISLYKHNVGGSPRKIICANLIMTPEFIRKMTSTHPDVILYAVRLDRGLSPPDVLRRVPGEAWDQERGLDDKQYIVPGAGGMGEVMNNSFV